MFSQLGQMADLMRNAGKIRETMEKTAATLGQMEIEGSTGGGLVTAKVNGRMELLSVRINPKLVKDGDVELIEDLTIAAVNQALAKAREVAAQSLSETMPGLPGGLSNMFGS